jgi:hypothetical protein
MRRQKLILVFMLLATLGMLGSCSTMGGQPVIFDNSRSVANARMEQILDALESKDKDALRSLFSQKALRESGDFDADTDYLFELFQGNVISCTQGSGLHSAEKSRYGKRSEELDSYYIVETDVETYKIEVNDYVTDTIDPGNEGLYALYVRRGSVVGPNDNTGERSAGIYMPDVTFDMSDNVEDRANKRLQQITEAIRNRDKESLEALFSGIVLEIEGDEFDTNADKLFDFLKGEIVSWEKATNPVVDGWDADKEDMERYKIAYYVNTDQGKYLFYIEDNILSDALNPDMKGLDTLQVIKAEDRETLFKWGTAGNTGIFIPGVTDTEEGDSEEEALTKNEVIPSILERLLNLFSKD